MCGIAGFLSDRPRDEKESRLRPMLRALEHRGPDDEGTYIDDGIALGFRRLSIIDLETGQQPLCNEDGTIWIAFNGEIYNFQELRSELTAKGHQFKSRTDSEVIVHAYEQWDTDCFDHLRGMFAIAIWDSRRQRLVLGVDRSGIKPLYYARTNEAMLFASEAKALFQSGFLAAEPDYSTLPFHMAFLTAPFPRTMFRGVSKLAPGSFVVYENERLQHQQYWDLDVNYDSTATRSVGYENVARRIENAVSSQLVADVPLGAFLSGGIDSSAICYYVQQALEDDLETYFIAFKKEDLEQDVLMDESRYAEEMAQHLQSKHRTIYATSDGIEQLLPRLIWHLDEPIGDPAAITTYLVSRSARETLTVLLSGAGADEIFGGYPRYLAMYLLSKYRRLPSSLRRVAASLASRLPGGQNALYRNVNKFAKAASRDPADAYLDMLTYFGPDEQRQLFSPDFYAEYGTDDVYTYHRQYMRNAAKLPLINRLQYLDYKTFLPCLNLMYTDKMSMAASIEVRVPYLDESLVQQVFELPASMKLRRWKRKYALKRAMAKRLPSSVVWRRKAGFGSPIHAWLRGDLRGLVETYLGPSYLKRQGIFSPAYVRALLDAEFRNEQYYSNHIWQLLTFQLWDALYGSGEHGRSDTSSIGSTAKSPSLA